MDGAKFDGLCALPTATMGRNFSQPLRADAHVAFFQAACTPRPRKVPSIKCSRAHIYVCIERISVTTAGLAASF